MSRFRMGFEDSLGRILREGLCVGCGSCVASCPLGCLEYSDGKPVLIGDCSSCGICSRVCPRYECSVGEVERFIFGRERMSSEEFGVYRRVCIARTRLREVRVKCQDGGVVTTLLLYAMEDGLIDGAVVSGFDEDEPLRAFRCSLNPRMRSYPQLGLDMHTLLICLHLGMRSPMIVGGSHLLGFHARLRL
ncbi:4Fe-4S binding protein [Candidatus Bathyarchaeota archaeon]|nr:4Fe-4S binding protein [Candidatus Bathyarchaeota archaeon]